MLQLEAKNDSMHTKGREVNCIYNIPSECLKYGRYKTEQNSYSHLQGIKNTVNTKHWPKDPAQSLKLSLLMNVNKKINLQRLQNPLPRQPTK